MRGLLRAKSRGAVLGVKDLRILQIAHCLACLSFREIFHPQTLKA